MAMHADAKIHADLEQGTPEWLEARRGIMTASEMNLVLSPKLTKTNNEKTRLHVFELAAQRVNDWTEPRFIGDAMLRGHDDEITARDLYSEKYFPVIEVGFITRDMGGFTLGYSPDGMGLLSPFGIEAKSRLQKHQMRVIVDDAVPDEHILQLQTGLLITGWDYIDYLSYSAGMPMWQIRVFPDPVYFEAIQDAAMDFEALVRARIKVYRERISDAGRASPTERPADDSDLMIHFGAGEQGE
tara:strand:- start:4274 stop:4999 length:726 start_codon:yes stop_codon:yes gene_type:complete